MTRGPLHGSDLAWCYDAVTDVSRTFALTISELEEPMAREICVGYLVCRVADTVEDDARIPPAQTVSLLRGFDDALDPETSSDGTAFRAAAAEWRPSEPGADWEVVRNSPRVLRTFRALDPDTRQCIRPPVRELIGGLASFVDRYAEEGGLRIRTAEELEEYCWYAAGTVGELVTNLAMSDSDPAVSAPSEANARSFGLLLQLVNVAKDAGRDYVEENNVYLPREWLSEAGVEPNDVGDPSAADRVGPVVERVTEHAATHLDGARAWLEAMPERRGNALAAWAIPYLLAVGTIRELERRPEDAVRNGDVKVDRAEVRALLAALDDSAQPTEIDRLRRQMRSQPLQES